MPMRNPALTTLPLALALAACAGSPAQPCSAATDTRCAAAADAMSSDRSEADATSPADLVADGAGLLPTWKDNPCAALPSHKPGFAADIARWTAQDKLAPPPPGGLLAVGSSSIRFWKTLQRQFTGWKVTQRGYGGSLIWDAAAYADKIITPYRPRAIMVYAGTNDIAKGSSPDHVITGYRCLIQRIKAGLGAAHVAFIGITPNPARWSKWSRSSQVNAAVKALTSVSAGLHYVDIPAAFLARGQPPPDSLFVADKLHLNDAGYALWNATIKPAVQKIAPPAAYKVPSGQPAAGARALVDLGPGDGDDGNHTTSPDAAGNSWNNWQRIDGGKTLLPGEAVALVDTLGKATPWRLVLAGVFHCNGLKNGGLKQPDSKLLGDLAVGAATQDYFFVGQSAGDQGMTITGLDPARAYRLRLFASREWAAETRTTRYTVAGAATASASLTTSGQGIGADGKYDGNDSKVVTLDNLKPDAHGKLHLTLRAEAGAYAYLSMLELVAK